MKKLGKAKRENVHAIEDALFAHQEISPMNWFSHVITFVLANKNLMMVCVGPETTRTHHIGTDSAIYDTLRKLSPKGFFRFNNELVELVDDMIRRRTATIGEKNESVFERVRKA